MFFSEDVHELLENKKLIVIGDSIQRSVYKDLICLWTQENSRYLSEQELRAKGELSFLGDKLLQGGKLEGKMVNGVGYREVRQFSGEKVFFKYYFVTRCYSEHMMSILNELKTWQPDVIVMNSTFWDLHHYGDTDMSQYRENLEKLMNEINEAFSARLVFIWNGALPLAERCKGGFLRKGFLTIPVDKIKTANNFAWLATNQRSKIYLDLFTELKDNDTFQQAEDGIHWGMRAHRKISNLILTEICKAWNRRIPAPPVQVVKRQDNRKNSRLRLSSYYPVIDNWSFSPTAIGYDDYETEYYVPPGYWGVSPSYDRYLTPSPLLASPYSSSRSNVSVSYNLPFTNVSGRAREYQRLSTPTPYFFPTRYHSIENIDLNFSTPQIAYLPGKTLFKPVIQSDPLHLRSFRSGVAQGLLPTPLSNPSFGFFNEGDRYRNRFKKLSQLRAHRYQSSSSSTSTPLTSATQNRQSASITPQNSLSSKNTEFSKPESVSKETPQISGSNQSTEVPGRSSTEHTPPNSSTLQNSEVSVIANGTDSSDHNNNEAERESTKKSCPTENVDSQENETKGASIDTSKQPNDAHVIDEGCSDNKDLHEELTSEGTQWAGLKRKHDGEGDEESRSRKIACDEGSDDYRGMKRKCPEDEADNEVSPIKCAREDGSPHVGGNEGPIIRSEGSPLKDTKESHTEELQTDRPNSPEVCQDVKCALTYDSFI
ncbi:PC-esterase domain-containing protein 1A-like [Montipora foliosa]|uniref:PC-esterase domain-containing protein 1A-like n=1 Tax=Montipora foliosa TaxID=591990 RepID=UPI0035F1FD2D